MIVDHCNRQILEVEQVPAHSERAFAESGCSSCLYCTRRPGGWRSGLGMQLARMAGRTSLQGRQSVDSGRNAGYTVAATGVAVDGDTAQGCRGLGFAAGTGVDSQTGDQPDYCSDMAARFVCS